MLRKIYIYGLAACLFLMALPGCIESKKIQLTASVPEKISFYELKTFTGSYHGGKIYINWVLNTNISNYYFVLEKSIPGEAFKVIQVEKGFSSPTKEGLLYSYVDENLTATSGTYRISAVEPVQNGKERILYLNNKNLFKDVENTVITVENEKSNSVNK